jgi:ABC-type phosphate/phosphonate transport system substrate-binding protein
MIASLPMYDRDETAGANDRLWQGIRAELGYGPEALTRDSAQMYDWLSPELVLSQTCGYPYRAGLHGKVNLIGTPDYGLQGCPPGFYYSVMVARADDPREDLQAFAEAPMAYNSPGSQSGWAAPQNHAAAMGFCFCNTVASGGHHASAKAVAEGRADIAAVDGLTWELLARYDDFAKGLRIVDRTTPTPTLPYITALNRDADAIFTAIACAIEGLSPQDRDALHLKGLVAIPAEDYLSVPNPPAPAA